MDFYIEYNIHITYAFLAFSFLWLNASLVLNSKFLILEKLIKNTKICFTIRTSVIFALSYFLDYATQVKPMATYLNWQTYAIFGTTIFLLCMPSFIYLVIKKYL
jgi:hypothetical protein